MDGRPGEWMKRVFVKLFFALQREAVWLVGGTQPSYPLVSN